MVSQDKEVLSGKMLYDMSNKLETAGIRTCDKIGMLHKQNK